MAYFGVHRFNRKDHKTRRPKDQAEIVEVAVPPIIDREEFEACRLSSGRAPRR